MYAEMIGKLRHTAAAVSAHGAFAVGVVVFHFKVKPGFIIQQHQSVSADSKAAVASL